MLDDAVSFYCGKYIPLQYIAAMIALPLVAIIVVKFSVLLNPSCVYNNLYLQLVVLGIMFTLWFAMLL